MNACNLAKNVSSIDLTIAKSLKSNILKLDAKAILCRESCPVYEKRNIYRDESHLSQFGSLKFVPFFRKLIA